jgi:hypothetical protein
MNLALNYTRRMCPILRSALDRITAGPSVPDRAFQDALALNPDERR